MKNLLIKNAKLRYTNELTDILICDGIFQNNRSACRYRNH